MNTSYPISLQPSQDAQRIWKFISDSWYYDMLAIRYMISRHYGSMAIFNDALDRILETSRKQLYFLHPLENNGVKEMVMSLFFADRRTAYLLRNMTVMMVYSLEYDEGSLDSFTYTTPMYLSVGNRSYLIQEVFDHYEAYVADGEYRNEYQYFIRCGEYKCSDLMQFCDDCRKAVRHDRNVRKRQYRKERREVIREMEEREAYYKTAR